MTINRDEALSRLRERIEKKIPIVGGGAGTGISAKFEEAGGIDLIIIYNSGRFRMAGRGSLAGLMPYGDANGIVIESKWFIRSESSICVRGGSKIDNEF